MASLDPWRPVVRQKLGECLIQAGLITEEDLHTALAEQQRTGERVGAVFVRLNLATEKQVTKAIAYQLRFPFVNLTEEPPDRAALILIPRALAVARECVAVKLEGNLLTVAMSDPLLTGLVQELEQLTGHHIKQVIATRSDILESIRSGYPSAKAAPQVTSENLRIDVRARTLSEMTLATGGTSLEPATAVIALQPSPDSGETSGQSTDVPAIDDLIDLVFGSIVQSQPTDVHIELTGKRVIVRHRLDGLLTPALELPPWAHAPLIDRLKMLAGMNTSETRLPQQGQLHINGEDGSPHRFRAFTLNTLFGEKFVLRSVDRRQDPPPIEELGMSAPSMEQVGRFLRHTQGVVLVVGPTGSGKTTTLSSVVSAIKSRRTNIVTIESPIEYRIEDVNQTQVDDEAGLTFATALDAVLLQDADVVFVAELANEEIAATVMRAALKGKLVLSSVHAADAVSAIDSLEHLEVDRSTIAAALVGVVAQRLVRRLCVSCRRQYTPDAETLRALAISETSAAQVVFYHAVGCAECHHTGYRGRIGLFEVMRVEGKVRHLLARDGGADLIREAAIASGMVSLAEDGIGKVKAGITSADELLRVLNDLSQRRSLCPNCASPVTVDFTTCPHCGHRLGGCPKCARPQQPDWKYCPYCAAIMVSHKKKKKFKDRKASEPTTRIAEFKNQNR